MIYIVVHGFGNNYILIVFYVSLQLQSVQPDCAVVDWTIVRLVLARMPPEVFSFLESYSSLQF